MLENTQKTLAAAEQEPGNHTQHPKTTAAVSAWESTTDVLFSRIRKHLFFCCFILTFELLQINVLSFQ